MGAGSDDAVPVEEVIALVQETEDYFEILGVERSATTKEISKAYRRLALRLHPDKCSLEGGEDAFKKVSQAFVCLRDEGTRARYERYGLDQAVSAPQHSPHDIFQEMFATMERASRERAAAGGGSNAAGFTFTSMGSGPGGATFVSINGQSLAEVAPAWLQPVLKAVPAQVFVALAMILVLSLFSAVTSFVFQRLQFFLPILFFVRPPLRGFLLALVVVLGLAGVL